MCLFAGRQICIYVHLYVCVHLYVRLCVRVCVYLCLAQVVVVQQVQRPRSAGYLPPQQPGGVTVPLEAQLALHTPPGAHLQLPLLDIGWNDTPHTHKHTR